MLVLKRSLGPVAAGESVTIGTRHAQDLRPEWGLLCELLHPAYSDPIAYVHEVSLNTYVEDRPGAA